MVQFFYPSARLLPFAQVDGVGLGGWSKADAISELNDRYSDLTVGLHFGNTTDPYLSPHLAEIGMTADNSQRVSRLMYPWYLRLIPTSILWAHWLVGPNQPPDYSRDSDTLRMYLLNGLGPSCQIAAKDASLRVEGDVLAVVSAQQGGNCNIDEVVQAATDSSPTLTYPAMILPMQGVDPAVTNQQAQTLADTIMAQLDTDLKLKVGNTDQTIPVATVLGWLDFTSVDAQLKMDINFDRADSYFEEHFGSGLTIPPGVTTITTSDYQEVSRVTGNDGQTLDLTATLAQLKDYLLGSRPTAEAVVKVVPATIEYQRSYSATDTGFAALLQNYVQTHAGTYGISFVELSGKHRHAAYHGNSQFITASTYKLFVAYSSLRRIESGAWQWSDQITGGRDLSTCFNDMIILSDNACAKALLEKIGFTTITNEARAIGAYNTSFLGKDGIKSTSEDEALLLSLLQTGQILNQQSSRDRWISALKRNIYRQGVPKGIPSATVADKVGFLDALLHDAAIVYAPSGTYVLVVLTENASWGNIAELAGQVEALRNQ